MPIEKLMYTAQATCHGGRQGRCVSSDKRLDVALTPPQDMGGSTSPGTNPEQLFAAAYSACFLGALMHVAAQREVELPRDTTVTGQVGLGLSAGGAFSIQAELYIEAPGMSRPLMEDLVEQAHEVCPYSHATRGNIDVNLVVA